MMKKNTIGPALFSLIPVLMLALFIGCGDGAGPGGGTAIEIPTTGVQVYRYLDGSLQPYTGNGTVKIAYDWVDDRYPLYLPGSGGTVVNGKFTLNLPSRVADEYLIPASDDFPSTVSLSPSDIKVLYQEGFELVTGSDESDESFLGWLSFEKETETEIDVISYIYSSKAGTVAGTATTGGGTEIYNLTLKQGWNPVYVHGEDTTKEYSLTTDATGMPSDMQWEFFPR
jgi:hypothetical protein